MHGWSLASLAVLLTLCGNAVAQTKGPEFVAPSLDRKACAEHNLQGKNDVQGDTHETQGRAPAESSLSEKLAQSGGVICPPEGLDPDIRAPAPNGGRTPVIPPPPPGEGPPGQQN
jgi:hypothetical protein